MAYTFKNIKLAKTYYNSNFWSRDNLEVFIDSLYKGNITVIDSLRSMKTALGNFQATSVKGKTLFATNTRWPEAADPLNDTLYYSDANLNFSRTLRLITSVLNDIVVSSTREQANANANLPRNNQNNNNATLEDEGRAQKNAFKQFSELRNTLSGYLNDESQHLDRVRIESIISANWVVAQVTA